MQQTAISFDERTPWDVLLSALDDAVNYLGQKECVFKLNTNKSTLCDALKDRNDRYWRQEWTLIVLEMLADRYSDTCNQLAKRILDAQAAVTRRFEVVSRANKPSPEDFAAAERVRAWERERERSA